MKVLVGVSGGIAVYKAAELVRALQQRGADVQVAMTRSARRFVTPLTFAALSGHPVFGSLWQPSGEQPTDEAHGFAIEHIAVAQQIDALAVVPATANILAKFAHGLADDFMTTLYLATEAPVLVAPAMNVNMWRHPATQANLALLRERGVSVVEPDAGYLACGMTGDGRLAAIEEIAERVLALRGRQQDLVEETVLITAGGTREPLDPVRFLGNRSSGKMGHALAQAAVDRGAQVALVTASSLPGPAGARVVRVATAAEMMHAVLAEIPAATLVIKAAAVADFRARSVAAEKMRRAGSLRLELEPTEDIAQEVVKRRREGTIVVAFAAETEHVEANARAKLQRKGVDAIVANDVSDEGIAFDSEENAGFFLTSQASIALPRSSKRAMADRILDEVIQMRSAQQVAQP